MRVAIDLNADLGEECGDDAAMCSIVSSANVAGGGHAGGGLVLADTVAAAASAGVAVGAHPAYPDVENFGRISRFHDIAPDVLFSSLCDQILAVVVAAYTHDVALNHIKAHGALYNDAFYNTDVAMLIAEAALAVSPTCGVPAVPVMGMPGSALERECASRGIPFLFEGFADRRYLPDGTLMPRSQPGSVLHDPDEVAAQALQIVLDGTVTASDGSILAMQVDSLCVHGDTPGAVDLARRIRHDLEHADVLVTRWVRA